MNPEEAVLPDKFREKALEPGNAVDHLTATLRVPRAVIVAELEDFCRYREAGGGMGDRRPYWLKQFRTHVLRRAKANELKPIGAVEHAATTSLVNRDATRQRNVALITAAAAGDYGAEAQETARSGSRSDRAMLVMHIVNGVVRRTAPAIATLGDVLARSAAQ